MLGNNEATCKFNLTMSKGISMHRKYHNGISMRHKRLPFTLIPGKVREVSTAGLSHSLPHCVCNLQHTFHFSASPSALPTPQSSIQALYTTISAPTVITWPSMVPRCRKGERAPGVYCLCMCIISWKTVSLLSVSAL